MIFDGIVGPSFQDFGDFGPLVVELPVHHEQDPLFLFAPAAFLDLWIQVVVPSLSALLSNSRWKVFGNHCPFLSTNTLDELNEDHILLRCPRSFACLPRGTRREVDIVFEIILIIVVRFRIIVVHNWLIRQTTEFQFKSVYFQLLGFSFLMEFLFPHRLEWLVLRGSPHSSCGRGQQFFVITSQIISALAVTESCSLWLEIMVISSMPTVIVMISLWIILVWSWIVLLGLIKGPLIANVLLWVVLWVVPSVNSPVSEVDSMFFLIMFVIEISNFPAGLGSITLGCVPRLFTFSRFMVIWVGSPVLAPVCLSRVHVLILISAQASLLLFSFLRP